MALDHEALRAKSQKALLEFLGAELDLGATFVQSAELARDDGHTEHCQQAKRGATRAAESIRQFLTHIQDERTQAGLEHRLKELDRLIATI